MDKKQLRQEFLDKRGELSPSYVAAASTKNADLITNTEKFKSANIVSSYYPFRNEVDLLHLLSEKSKNSLFPRVIKGSKKLDFYRVNSINDFEKGVFGLMEPKTSLPKVKIEDIDLFLVPGVAFTKTGLRLGYGGGYYDETLKHRNSSSIKIGICFDIQLTNSLPSDPWDIKMDFIITESEIVNCRD